MLAGRIVIGPLFTFFQKYVKSSTLLEMDRLYLLNKFNYLKFSQFKSLTIFSLRVKWKIAQVIEGLGTKIVHESRKTWFIFGINKVGHTSFTCVWRSIVGTVKEPSRIEQEKMIIKLRKVQRVGSYSWWCRVSDIIWHLLCCNGDQDKLGGKKHPNTCCVKTFIV